MELTNKIKEQLKELLTAENTEAITSIVAELDAIEQKHQATIEENGRLKDKIVDVVKGTTFSQPSESNIEPDRPLSIDEAILKLN